MDAGTCEPIGTLVTCSGPKNWSASFDTPRPIFDTATLLADRCREFIDLGSLAKFL